MDWDVIASSRVTELTKTQSNGRPVNTHVVQSRKASDIDYNRMRDIVHSSGREKQVA